MNGNNLEQIRRRIECEQEKMPKASCCCGVRTQGGTTGPTGATERLFKSSNKIIIDSS